MTWPNPNTDPALAVTEVQFLEMALSQSRRTVTVGHEFNAPAGIIQVLDAEGLQTKAAALTALRHYAELGMVQLALINLGLNPGSSWMAQAVRDGWRYRAHFYKDFSA